jgi:signal transduction histidine kinase
LLVAIASTLAFPIVHLVQSRELDPNYLILIIPASIAAFGGRLTGTLLDTAASRLTDASASSDGPWSSRPLSKRFVLAVALVAIAVAGLPSVSTNVRALQHPAATWLSMVWQIMTLLGWIGFTPVILGARSTRDATTRVEGGLTPGAALTHVAVIAGLAMIHALAVVSISAALFIPMIPSWSALVRAAFVAYLPLDLLAYVTILALGYVSDVERHRREAARREAALRAETLESRMSALRARLNPHFLFNALNSVDVLARAGKTERMSKVLDGLTGLLRYVLDERRANVPLREELDFVRSYLDVQQVRFGDRLSYSLVMPSGVEDALVPQLMLQPIIENAVEHGIAQTLDGGTVRIEAARHGEALEVTIEDNGPGVGGQPSTPGIGLSSTRERLARLFGDRASVSVESRPATRGTRVMIRIPFDVPAG